MKNVSLSAWIFAGGCMLAAQGCHWCRPGCEDNRCALFGGNRPGLFRAKNAVPAPAEFNGYQPSAQPAVPAPVPSGVAPTEGRIYPPPVPESSWNPSPNKVVPPDGTRLLPPEPGSGAAPEVGKPPAPAKKDETSRDSGEPPRVPSLPVGIPQFAPVKDKVASGLKPSLDGGLDWLQINGYKTVLHLRQPGEDNAADRREVEKRALKYLTLEVSPETLSMMIVEQFAKMVNDQANLPLFVYDKDGMLAGGLWYLVFRIQDKAADETARIAAGRLGLKEFPEGDHKAMWLAIQKLLNAQP